LGDEGKHSPGFLSGLIAALFFAFHDNAGKTGQDKFIGFFIPEFSVPN
jgi:hypothetical protein